MATQDLNVKFKVDASEVSKGSDEAKRKVKSAADTMASDVRRASSSMSSSMKDVERATQGIGNAAKAASNSVRQMEGDLKSVSRQMSAMQMFNMGSRGIGMLGGVASNVLKLQGNYEGAETVNGAVKVGQGAFQGAAMGFAMGGPLGSAVGGLIGAGNALLEAAVEQKEAARELLKGSVKSIEDIEERYQSRIRQETIASQATATNFDVDNAQKQIDEAKQALEDAKSNQRTAQDNLYGRNGGINWMDESQRNAFIEEERERLYGKKGERSWGQAIAEWTDPMLDRKNNDPEQIVAEQYKLFAQEASNADKEVQRAQQRLAELAPLQARIDAEKAKSDQFWLNSQAEFWNSGAGKAFDDYQNGKDLKDQLKIDQASLADYQRQLNGVMARPADTPSDALTRIGGGRGYSAYNNSAANVQKQIEGHLRSVIDILQKSIDETTSRLDALINKDTELVWANP